MSIKPIKGQRGEELALCACDECSAEESVRAAHSHGPGGGGGAKMALKNEGQVTTKLQKAGWSLVKGKLRCPRCEEKRKVVPMKPKEAQTEAPREPTRQQKLQIMDMLKEVYDTDAERYMSGDTDDTVADVLGVLPGWVANIRDEFFGPDGGNEDIEDLATRIEKLETDLPAIIEAARHITETGSKRLAEVSTMKADLEKIKEAVGPRILKKAGVRG